MMLKLIMMMEMRVITQLVMILTLFTQVNGDAAIVTNLEHEDLILKPGTDHRDNRAVIKSI